MRCVGANCPIYRGAQGLEFEWFGQQPQAEFARSLLDLFLWKGSDHDHRRAVAALPEQVDHVETGTTRQIDVRDNQIEAGLGRGLAEQTTELRAIADARDLVATFAEDQAKHLPKRDVVLCQHDASPDGQTMPIA